MQLDEPGACDSLRPDRTANAGDGPARRSALVAVAVPTEHGGWGLTLEPGILGLLVAPSAAGVCLALAALVAFVARTPAKVVLVDRWRHRHLPRTTLAARVAAIELLVLAGLVAAAVTFADGPFWIPALVAGPLVAIELWFDMRSKSRRLVPELAGAIGVCATAAMIAMADDAPTRLAAGLWLILAARVVSSIPFVRGQIARLHGRPHHWQACAAADTSALVLAASAVVCDRELVAGALAVVCVMAIQRASATRPMPRPAVLGARQVALGLGVVLTAGLGVLAP